MSEPVSPTRRFYRLVGWLLTPLVAWAASFLGAWLGAVVGASARALVIGSVMGAVAGAAGWGMMMTATGRGPSTESEENP
ncbi:MAG TPA: hypothetical protein VGI83_08425 [Gemmatimonadales bacterium]